MKWSGGCLILSLILLGQVRSFALADADPGIAASAYDTNFLNATTNGYKSTLADNTYDYYWQQAEDIQAEETIFEHTGNPSDQALISVLGTEFLAKYSDSWVSSDTWNDDLGRAASMLARANLMTNTSGFLTGAEYAFNTAYDRGWDTQFNGGGIYEQMGVSNPEKAAIANVSCGLAAAQIYQAGGGSTYLTKAGQIYSWIRTNIFNPTTGHVTGGVYTNGNYDTSNENYNQGWFIDFANTLYEITGDSQYYNDANAALGYDITNCTTGAAQTLGAVGSLSRAVGHFVGYNNLWTTYYPWMITNANTGWNIRRTDLNIGWNKFTDQTPVTNGLTPNQCIGWVEWMQVTPTRTPPAILGTHYLINKLSGRCLQSPAGTNDAVLVQWGYTGDSNQQWTVATDSGTGDYTLTSVSCSLLAEDSGNSQSSGNPIDQNPANGQHDQVWLFIPCPDGFFKLQNYHSGMVMAVRGSSTSNGAIIEQETDTGAPNQRWKLQN